AARQAEGAGRMQGAGQPRRPDRAALPAGLCPRGVFGMIVRNAVPGDAPAMAALLNAIIALGGTTAHQHPKTRAQVRADYIDGPEALTCVVAEEGGQVIGFQAVGVWPGLSAGWGDIGTFVSPGLQAR